MCEFDFGTATNLDVVDGTAYSAEHISPGIMISAALCLRAQLSSPAFLLKRETVLDNTTSAVQAGICGWRCRSNRGLV